MVSSFNSLTLLLSADPRDPIAMERGCFLLAVLPYPEHFFFATVGNAKKKINLTRELETSKDDRFTLNDILLCSTGVYL